MLATHVEHVCWKRALACGSGMPKEHVYSDELLVYGNGVRMIDVPVMTVDEGGHERLKRLEHVYRISGNKVRVFKWSRGCRGWLNCGTHNCGTIL